MLRRQARLGLQGTQPQASLYADAGRSAAQELRLRRVHDVQRAMPAQLRRPSRVLGPHLPYMPAWHQHLARVQHPMAPSGPRKPRTTRGPADFIPAGRAYRAAPDEYAYVHFPVSANTQGNGTERSCWYGNDYIILARVKRTLAAVSNRSANQWFTGEGKPWVSDDSRAEKIFEYHHMFGAPHTFYNAPIKVHPPELWVGEQSHQDAEVGDSWCRQDRGPQLPCPVSHPVTRSVSPQTTLRFHLLVPAPRLSLLQCAAGTLAALGPPARTTRRR